MKNCTRLCGLLLCMKNEKDGVRERENENDGVRERENENDGVRVREDGAGGGRS